jgi:integrase
MEVNMAVIEKRKTADGETHYRVKIRLKGHPAQTSTHQTLRDAKRWAQQTESAIREGRHFKSAEAKKHTAAEMFDRYIRDVLPQKKLSHRKQVLQLLWWKDQIGSYLLADITPPLIVEHRDALARGLTFKGTQRSPATVVRYLAALSHVFTIAVQEWGWLDDSPMRKVSKPKEPRGRVRFLDQEELDRLLFACKESPNPWLYPAVMVAVSTGMRYGELMNLTWGDIDFTRKRIILHETKNGERRAVPIAGQAYDLLMEMEKNRRIDTNILFPKLWATSNCVIFQKHDLEKVQKVQKPVQLRSAWKTALQKARIEDFRFHDLRHCAASYLAMSGASLTEIADILGHKTLAMVKRYSHLSETHKHAVVDRMNKHFIS